MNYQAMKRYGYKYLLIFDFRLLPVYLLVYFNSECSAFMNLPNKIFGVQYFQYFNLYDYIPNNFELG